MRCTLPPCPVETPVSRFPPAGILCTSCWGCSLRAVDFSGSLERSVWSGPRSSLWSGQRPGHGSVRSGQWSGESLLSLANGGQSLWSGQGWPKSVRSGKYLSLGMVGLANAYLVYGRSDQYLSWVANFI